MERILVVERNTKSILHKLAVRPVLSSGKHDLFCHVKEAQ